MPIVLCFCLCAAAAWAADPVEGAWVSVDDKSGEETAVWEFYVVDDILYGKMTAVVVQPPNPLAYRCKESYRGFPFTGKVNEMPVVGTPWIFGLRKEKPGQWKGGSVINPEDGALYKCGVTFHPADGKKYPVDTLEMRGEIGLGIGRSQFWTPASAADVERMKQGG